MARPTKQGIDYFPYDVDLDQDDKLAMIIGEYGMKGEFIYTKLLAWIYKHYGYCIEWNEQEQLKFAKRVAYGDVSANLIKEVVAKCIKWGLFDKAVFDMFQVLTSKRIQETWLEATRRRKDRIIVEKYWLNAVNDDIMTSKTNKIPSITTQSKVKEIKVNESEVGNSPPPENHFGDTVFKSVDILAAEALADTMFFLPPVMREFNISAEDVKKHMQEFVTALKSESIFQKSITDFRRHFKNQLRKKLEYQKQSPQQNSTDAYLEQRKKQEARTRELGSNKHGLR